jgi:cell division protein FtsQ
MRGLKLRFKLPLIIGIIAVILAILWFVFLVREVSVEGNTFYSESQVAESYQSHFWQKNMLTNIIMDAFGFTEDPPYVREAEISYPSFGELHIKLYEKVVLAGVKFSNHYIYFDKDGMVLKTTEQALPDIPFFESEDVTDFTLYHRLSTGREELLEQMINLSNRLTYYKIDWDKADFDTEGHATIYSGPVTVRLGRRSDYDEVVSILPDILKTARKTGDKGTIDMVNYKAGSTIIFKKDAK